MRPANKKKKKRISQSLMIRVKMSVEKPNMKLSDTDCDERNEEKSQSTVKPKETKFEKSLYCFEILFN
jgi:hypothetical protein